MIRMGAVLLPYSSIKSLPNFEPETELLQIFAKSSILGVPLKDATQTQPMCQILLTMLRHVSKPQQLIVAAGRGMLPLFFLTWERYALAISDPEVVCCRYSF